MQIQLWHSAMGVRSLEPCYSILPSPHHSYHSLDIVGGCKFHIHNKPGQEWLKIAAVDTYKYVPNNLINDDTEALTGLIKTGHFKLLAKNRKTIGAYKVIKAIKKIKPNKAYTTLYYIVLWIFYKMKLGLATYHMKYNEAG